MDSYPESSLFHLELIPIKRKKEDILKEIGHEVTNELCRILENPEHKNDLYSMFLELE